MGLILCCVYGVFYTFCYFFVCFLKMCAMCFWIFQYTINYKIPLNIEYFLK